MIFPEHTTCKALSNRHSHFLVVENFDHAAFKLWILSNITICGDIFALTIEIFHVEEKLVKEQTCRSDVNIRSQGGGVIYRRAIDFKSLAVDIFHLKKKPNNCHLLATIISSIDIWQIPRNNN